MKEKINEILNLPQFLSPKINHEMMPITKSKNLEEVTKDFDDVHHNMRTLIHSVKEVLEEAAVEVKSNPSPRMYEAFCTLVSTFSTINRELLTLHQFNQEPQEQISEDEMNKKGVLFIGSIETLIDAMRLEQES